MLELRNVTKTYKTKDLTVNALDDVNLCFGNTGMVFVVGKSGSGKTSLLNVIGALDSFDSGEIIIDGKSSQEFSRSDFDSYRNSYIGFVFQEYNLLDSMNIEKNVGLAMQLQKMKQDKAVIDDILQQVDLHDVSKRKPQELSGGQRQRVAIARALVKNPSIIMADEPTGALDTENGIQVISLLKRLSKEKLVIVVSHNTELANNYADRIITMKDGKIESDISIKTDNTIKKNVDVQKDAINVRSGAALNTKELAEIKTAVAEGKNVIVTKNMNVVREATKIEKPTGDQGKVSFIKTHLSVGNQIKLGFNAMKTKVVRLIITIILCSLAFSIFGVFDGMAIYDESRLATNTIKSSITPSISMSAKIREENGNVYNINVSDSLLTALQKQTGYSMKGVYNSYFMGNTRPLELNNNEPYKNSRYYYYKNINGAVEFTEDELKQYGFSMVAGRLPAADAFDEIAVSEYYANCMVNWSYTYTKIGEANIGTPTMITDVAEIVNEENPVTITLGYSGQKATYKIVGIVKTGTINKKFDSLRKDFENATVMLQNEFLNYINNGYFLYTFVAPGFADHALTENGSMNRFINDTYKYELAIGTQTRQITDFYNLGSLKTLLPKTNYFFVTGDDKVELADDEIMIDISQFKNYYNGIISELSNYVEANKADKPDLATKLTEFNAKLSTINSNLDDLTQINNLQAAIALLQEIQADKDTVEETNLADTLFIRQVTATKTDKTKINAKPEKLKYKDYKIVGFFVGAKIKKAASVVMSNNGMSNLGINLMQGKYASFIATKFKSGKASALSALLTKTQGINYSCNNNALATIRANSDFFSNLSLIFLAASGIFAVFSVMMFSNFISVSIRNKYGEIGILRALGARSRDVMSMFLVETLIIAIINAVAASLLAVFGCMAVNLFLAKYLNLYIPLAYFGFRQIMIIAGLSVGVGVLSATLPIIALSRQKPVETIRKSY